MRFSSVFYIFLFCLRHISLHLSQHNNIELDSVAKEMNEAINKATADHELRMRQLQDRVDAMDRTVNGESFDLVLL